MAYGGFINGRRRGTREELTPRVLERAEQAVDRSFIFQPCLGSEIRSPSTAPSQTKSSPKIRLTKDLP